MPSNNIGEHPDQLAACLTRRVKSIGMDSPEPSAQVWIAICGPPGSGKSTLAAALQSRLGSIATVIPMDGYHLRRSDLDRLPDPDVAHRRRGAPFTFDSHRFVSDLKTARVSRAGRFPSFDHGVGDPEEDRILLTPQHRIVIVEGNYLLLPSEPWCHLKPLFDETWFLDVHIDVCKSRVLRRHIATGKDPEIAQQRVEDNDGPNAKLIIQECRCRADRCLTLTMEPSTLFSSRQ